MPVSDPRTGNICVWLVSFVFFIAIVSGGALLLMYIALPETESTTWFAVGGVLLVSIPWFFWFITFLYRIIAHGGGAGGHAPVGDGVGGGGAGRDKGGGGGSIGGGAATAATLAADVPGATTNQAENTGCPMESSGSFERRVRFGAAVVVGRSSSQGRDEENHRTSASSGISNDDELTSFASRESEVPLTLSMAS